MEAAQFQRQKLNQFKISFGKYRVDLKNMIIYHRHGHHRRVHDAHDGDQKQFHF